MNELLNFKNIVNQIELVSYFSTEILCLLAILINTIIFLFLKRRNNINRLCDFVTFGAFSLGFLILFCLYFKSSFVKTELTFCVFKDFFVFSPQTVCYRMLLNLFFAMFLLVTYKINRRLYFKLPLVNSILLMLNIAFSFLFMSNYSLVSFLLLELIVFLVYKYASSSTIREEKLYSRNFVLIDGISSVLFFAFYFISFVIKDTLQLSIIQVCLSCAILLKAGLFPIYNYTVGRKYKNNLPWAILVFCLIPLSGLLVFSKFLVEFNYKNEVYFITLLTFLSVLILSCSINVLKSKNIVRFLSNASLTYFGIGVLTFLITLDETYILFGLKVLFMLLAVYSLICILKINLKPEKINVSLLKGAFVKNRIYAAFLSLLLLTFASFVPSGLLASNVIIFKTIYEFDKIGTYPAFVCLLALVFVFLNSLKIVKTIYTFDKQNYMPKLKKGTIFNYIVPLLIILFFFFQLFL